MPIIIFFPIISRKEFKPKFISETSSTYSLNHRSIDGITLIQYQGKLVALVEEQLKHKSTDQPIEVDYVIVAKNAVRSVERLDQYFIYQQLIIDGTNSYYVAKKLTEEAEQKHIAYHSVPLQGALTINFSP